MRELKTCPFCRGEASVKTDSAMFAGLFWLVGCYTPKCRGSIDSGPMYYSEEEAIEAWNKRADEANAKPYINHGDHGPEPRFPGDAWTVWYCCGNCDHAISHGDAYCKTCGARIDWSDVSC